MKKITSHIAAGCAAAVMLGATTASASPDDATMRGYVLTMDKLHKYQQVGTTLQGGKDPAVRAELPKLDNFMGGSIAEALAKLRSAPHVQAAIHRAGLSDIDFVLIPEVTMGAAMAQMASPAARRQMPVSAANIAFVQQHQAEIKAMHLGG